MYGGIALARNLLCLTYTDVRGRVFLVDLEEKRPVDFWEFRGFGTDYADAGGVAIDRNFILCVADARNDAVRRFTAFGRELPAFGAPHERPPGAKGRDRTGSLSRPNAVAAFDGILYVACGEQHLRRGVQRFTCTGEVLPPLAAFGDAAGEFGAPRGIAAGPQGIFVADTLNGVVQRFTRTGRYVNEIVTGPGPGTGTGRTRGRTSRPIAVQPLGDDTLLVVDEGDERGLWRFELSGRPLGRVDLDGVLVDPVGIARDDEGRLYVLDRDGERVVRLAADLSCETDILDLREYLHDG